MEIRPIDVNALYTPRNVRRVTEYDETGCGIDYLAVPWEVIKKAPTINYEHAGEWKEYGCNTFCTNCGEKPLYDYFGKLKLSKCCPNCGAKMDAKEE
jgi:hypothetical protein